jgi:hypothetical protein
LKATLIGGLLVSGPPIGIGLALCCAVIWVLWKFSLRSFRDNGDAVIAIGVTVLILLTATVMANAPGP